MARGLKPDPDRGERIQGRRHQLYLSSEELATEVGVSKRTIEGWELGAGITRPNLRALAEALDVAPQDLENVPTKEETVTMMAPPAEPDQLAARVTDLERDLGEVRTILSELVELLAGTALTEQDEALDRLSGQLGPTSPLPLRKPGEARGQ